MAETKESIDYTESLFTQTIAAVLDRWKVRDLGAVPSAVDIAKAVPLLDLLHHEV